MLLRHITRPLKRPAGEVDEKQEHQPVYKRYATLPTDADKAKADFLAVYGKNYGYSGRIDELYEKEIQPRLGPNEHYLDYTGSGLYWNSQIRHLEEELETTAYGNPHSVNPSSTRATHVVEEVREDLLHLFGASPDEYELVFTRSATGALQMVGEMFPWSDGSEYVYLQGNHKSVLGIREYVKRQGKATFTCMTEEDVEAWLKSPKTKPDEASGEQGSKGKEVTYSLFAYPAYDNYNGVMNPLEWVKAVQAKSTTTRKWKVLLDTAAFAPCHKINLSEIGADCIDLSFYKMFGHPSGVGALILKKDLAAVMKKVYWGGSSGQKTVPSVDWIELAPGPEEFEDGSLPFLGIIELRHGLRVVKELGGTEAIERHTAAIGNYLYEQANRLCHTNGARMLEIYGHHDHPERAKRQGATLSFSLLDSKGEYLSWLTAVQDMADAGLHVRGGCSCNPGQHLASVGVKEEELLKLIQQKDPTGVPFPWEWIVVKRGGAYKRKPLGSIRASLGFMSRFEDVHALIHFLVMTYKDAEADIKTVKEDVVDIVSGCQEEFKMHANHPSPCGGPTAA